MTEVEIARIYEGLNAEPLWMQRAFHTALHTGLRLGETQIRREAVDVARRTIEIARPKGRKKRAFSIPLYKSIEPMLREFLESSAPVLWLSPPRERALTDLAWTRFFRRIGLQHLCFHCTRTIVITRGALGDLAAGIAPVPEAVMMRLVNHAQREIHRIYQRFAGADFRAYGATIRLPGTVRHRRHSTKSEGKKRPSVRGSQRPRHRRTVE